MILKYSNKTLDEMARFISQNFKNDEMDSLFLNVSVPTEFNYGPSKLKRALNVITKLAYPDELNLAGVIGAESFTEVVTRYRDILDELFTEVVARRKNLFESNTISYSQQSAQPLLRALRADGYEVRDGKLISLDGLASEVDKR